MTTEDHQSPADVRAQMNNLAHAATPAIEAALSALTEVCERVRAMGKETGRPHDAEVVVDVLYTRMVSGLRHACAVPRIDIFMHRHQKR